MVTASRIVFVFVLLGLMGLDRTEGGKGVPPYRAGWRNTLRPKGPLGELLTLAQGGETDYVIVLPSPTEEREQR